MHKSFRLLKWAWRSWPVIISIVLIAIHFILISYACFETSVINKNISLFSQIIGGLLILYSIDSNIGIIKEKNLLTIFNNYINDYPSSAPKTHVQRGNLDLIFTDNTTFSTAPTPKHETIEDKINLLQDKINTLSTNIENLSNQTNKSLLSQIQYTFKIVKLGPH